MRIVLINVSGRLSTEGSRLISALLKRSGHSVKSVFMVRKMPLHYSSEELDGLHDVVKEADLVMVAVYSLFAIRAVQVTKFVRKYYPGIKVIWGGPHCISAPRLSLEYADGVCFAEGDQVVTEFVDRLEKQYDFIDIPNMAFNVDGRYVINEVLPPFADLDSLPFPDDDMKDQYVLENGLFHMTRDLLIKHTTRYPFEVPTLWVLTSRGCPHRCSYCNNCRYISLYGRNPIRFRSVDNFISELEYSLNHSDYFESVGFADDDFLIRPKKQLEDFAEKYKRKIGLPFIVGASANTYNKDKLEILLDAGVDVIQMGVQSGSQRVLEEVFDRKVSVSKTMDAAREIDHYNRTHGLKMILDFIIDVPYETEEDIIKTYYCLVDIPQHVRVNTFVLTFFPGSPIYERALEDGYIEPFSPRTFRHYSSGVVIYQNNYTTFLIILIQLFRHLNLLKHIPRSMLIMMGRPLIYGIAGMLPDSIYAFFIRLIRR